MLLILLICARFPSVCCLPFNFVRIFFSPQVLCILGKIRVFLSFVINAIDFMPTKYLAFSRNFKYCHIFFYFFVIFFYILNHLYVILIYIGNEYPNPFLI